MKEETCQESGFRMEEKDEIVLRFHHIANCAHYVMILAKSRYVSTYNI